MKEKLNAKEFSDVLWIVCVGAAIIACTIAGWIDVPTCLGFVFVLLLNAWNVVDAAKARAMAGLRQAQADEELAKKSQRLVEAEKMLEEFYAETRGLPVGEITRIKYRKYKNLR